MSTFGKIIEVDLSAKKIEQKTLSEQTIRRSLGGFGYNVETLYDRLDPGIDPFDPKPTVQVVQPVTVPGQDLGEHLDRCVARRVALALVERHQVIQVEEDDREGIVHVGPGELPFEEDPGVAPVGESRQRIGEGRLRCSGLFVQQG